MNDDYTKTDYTTVVVKLRMSQIYSPVPWSVPEFMFYAIDNNNNIIKCYVPLKKNFFFNLIVH